MEHLFRKKPITREINAHLIDLSKDDTLDIKGISSIAEADIPTTLLTGTDASGLSKTALTKTDDIVPRSTFDTTNNELEIDLGTVAAQRFSCNWCFT